MIKIKIHCTICDFKAGKKINDRDSRGYFEVPNAYCNKCKIPMVMFIDGVNKNPDGEDDVRTGN